MGRKKKISRVKTEGNFHPIIVRLNKVNPAHADNLVYGDIKFSVHKDTLIDKFEDYKKIKGILPYLTKRKAENKTETLEDSFL
jgi:hypothetical protein